MPADRVQRNRGACLQCSRRKRKCDHKQPRCSQCAKHDDVCQPQTFKVWTAPVPRRKQSRAQTTKTRHAQGCEKTQNIPGREATTLSAQSPLKAPVIVQDPVEELLLDDEALSLNQHDPNHTLDGAIFDDATWLEGMQTLPITPRSQSLQLTQLGNPGIASNDVADDAVEVDRVTELGSLYEPNLSPSLLIGSFDSGTTSYFNDQLPDATSSIPMMLYCPMPLPDDMLASGSRRFLWEHFLHVAKSGFLCLDTRHVEHMQDFQDPFAVALPQMALFDKDLRSVIYYFSAFQYQASTNNQRYHAIMGESARDASQAVVAHANHSEEDHQKLLGRMTIALFLHLYGSGPKEIYLQVGCNLAIAYLRSFEQQKRTICVAARLVIALLRWSRISILCSLRQPETYLGQSIYGALEMDNEEINQNFSTSFQNWTQHPIYAFSPRLINPLLRLGQLLELRQTRYGLTGILEPLGPGLEAQVAELEAAILSVRDLDLITSQSRNSDPLDCLNEAMNSAALVLLYARLRGMPCTAPLIRHHVATIVTNIGKINPESRVNYARIFPIFIAGCDAVDSATRDAIERILHVPKGLFYNRGDLIGSLRHIWNIRDLEPGLTWLEWLGKVGPEYRIWCLF